MRTERRLNIRVSEDTHYWINLDAARHGRTLQEHVDALLSERARSISEQFGNVRPTAEEGRKAGAGNSVRYPVGGSPAPVCRDGE